jgi:hypothetical protein
MYFDFFKADLNYRSYSHMATDGIFIKYFASENFLHGIKKKYFCFNARLFCFLKIFTFALPTLLETLRAIV